MVRMQERLARGSGRGCYTVRLRNRSNRVRLTKTSTREPTHLTGTNLCDKIPHRNGLPAAAPKITRVRTYLPSRQPIYFLGAGQRRGFVWPDVCVQLLCNQPGFNVLPSPTSSAMRRFTRGICIARATGTSWYALICTPPRSGAWRRLSFTREAELHRIASKNA